MSLALSLAGCDTVSELVGGLSAARTIGTHLEEDVKAPLTEARISKVLEVIPSLKEFSKEAKVKWTPDPNANDFSQLATSVAGLSDYMSFFESHDTRITQFYTDFVKLNDARARLELEKGMADATNKLKAERDKLEKEVANAEGEAKKELERKLRQSELTLEKLEERDGKGREIRQTASQAGYTLTEAEIKLVEARLDEINAVFQAAGYEKKKPKKEN